MDTKKQRKTHLTLGKDIPRGKFLLKKTNGRFLAQEFDTLEEVFEFIKKTQLFKLTLNLKNMSILNITNLTDCPEQWIDNKYRNAFEEVEKELDITITDEEKRNFITTQIDWLEEQAEKTLGKDLLSLIDNYLVNLDYYSEVKEWYQSNQ
jgi:hypothetical protein